jgi:hypothetical protein
MKNYVVEVTYDDKFDVMYLHFYIDMRHTHGVEGADGIVRLHHNDTSDIRGAIIYNASKQVLENIKEVLEKLNIAISSRKRMQDAIHNAK